MRFDESKPLALATHLPYALTFSSILHVMLTIAAALDMELHQLDVDTAFLHSDLDEVVYMRIRPKGSVMGMCSDTTAQVPTWPQAVPQ